MFHPKLRERSGKKPNFKVPSQVKKRLEENEEREQSNRRLSPGGPKTKEKKTLPRVGLGKAGQLRLENNKNNGRKEKDPSTTNRTAHELGGKKGWVGARENTGYVKDSFTSP